MITFGAFLIGVVAGHYMGKAGAVKWVGKKVAKVWKKCSPF